MQKISRKFLLTFSLCSVAAIGLVWACADGGDDINTYSSFTPEAFVAKEYTPFFYTEYYAYYGVDYNSDADNSNTRFNAQVLNDWYDYLGQKISKEDLKYLLQAATYAGVDSVYNNVKGKIDELPEKMPQLKKEKLNRKLVDPFFDYLLLAKSCETFAATYQPYYWEEKQKKEVPAALEQSIYKAFDKSKDTFIKQRLWFQLLRYYYFLERAGNDKSVTGSKMLKVFDVYKDSFPHNMMYYRALGYVAGRYYLDGNFAMSNYLNSLCYDYSYEMKIPSKWSFHPQGESDWKKSLQLAKTDEEKITLWHLLGIHYDAERAIPEIIALNPKSDKLDLLLSRLVNITEFNSGSRDSAYRKTLKKNTLLVSSFASKNNSHKPYFWNLAAGYLNYLGNHYEAASTFYQAAKKQLPKNDKLIAAQYKILAWTLYIKQLKKIDAKAEAQMVEPLNWFANLRDGKDSIPDLRFYHALDESISTLASLYKKQGDAVKSEILRSTGNFYTNNQQIEALKALLKKTNKTPFEKAGLRYYTYKLSDLFHHQALAQVYQEHLDEAITLLEQSDRANDQLLGNPFNMRLNDCHDCDHQMKQSTKYTSLSLLKLMKNLKIETDAGRNVYNNALLLANAYYNITFYGNARTFYEADLIGSYASYADDIPKAYQHMFLSNRIAEKYYLMAAAAAKNRDQKARCVFLAAKCERNESYNQAFNRPENKNSNAWSVKLNPVFAGRYFMQLKQQYADTRFYQEALDECGYFQTYVNRPIRRPIPKKG